MARNDDRIAIFFILLLVAGGAILGFVAIRDALQQRLSHAVLPRVLATDPVLGNPDAPVTLIEYGDFECPFCHDAQKVVDAFLAKYPKTVRLVWKDFPLTMEHAEANTAAEAARCAQEQGQFWQMHDALFAQQDSLNTSLYSALAGALHLNTAQFQECMSTHRTQLLVSESEESGKKAGVDGTPYFFLNTIVINRVPTLVELDQALLQQQ